MHVQRKTSESSSETDQVSIIQKALMEWGHNNYAVFPWRSTRNPFHALVAEIMLQRTKAEQVVPVYNLFTSRYSTPHEASSEEPLRILKLLEPLGLNWRNKKILELIRELDQKGGKIPTAFKDLIKLPGVGPYAASAYLSFHLETRAPIIDSNAVRLWSRIFGIKKDGEMRRKKQFLILVEKITPRKKFQAFNYAVLDHTRLICKPKPICGDCPLNPFCEYYKRLGKPCR